MTCIAGIAQAGKVWIGGDSAGVAGLSMSVRADEKVFRKGEFVFGFTSSFRMGDLLRFSLNPPEQNSKQTDRHYLATFFIDAVRTCLTSGGYKKVENAVETGAAHSAHERTGQFSVWRLTYIATWRSRHANPTARTRPPGNSFPPPPPGTPAPTPPAAMAEPPTHPRVQPADQDHHPQRDIDSDSFPPQSAETRTGTDGTDLLPGLRSANGEPINEALTLEHDAQPPELGPRPWWLCPDGSCEHGAILHDVDELDDNTPRCCVDGCDCGKR